MSSMKHSRAELLAVAASVRYEPWRRSGCELTGRLRALAGYLDLPWSWLVERCAALGVAGAAEMTQPRKRLVTPAGIADECSYLGTLSVSSEPRAAS